MDAVAISEDGLRRWWPVPTGCDDKYSRGVVGIDTGSTRYPGAALLSTLGALRAGAGFVRFCGAEAARPAVLARCPSVTFGVGRVNAWVLGCGWDEDETNVARLAARLSDGVPCVIDAGALWVIDEALAALGWSSLPANCLLTPHAGELARLLGVDRKTVEVDPLGHAVRAAERFGAAVLLKGHRQFCASREARDDPSEAYEAMQGPSWTAQAGSGDVLAGLAGMLLAAGLSNLDAGAAAASLQALTATRHPGPWAPDHLADWFPETIATLAD